MPSKTHCIKPYKNSVTFNETCLGERTKVADFILFCIFRKYVFPSRLGVG